VLFLPVLEPCDQDSNGRKNQAKDFIGMLLPVPYSAILSSVNGIPTYPQVVADALVVRGIEVMEIVDSSPPKPHKLTPFARVDGTRVTYPDETGGLLAE
jgi:hypothetical protein